jgi:hypothetical protein
MSVSGIKSGSVASTYTPPQTKQRQQVQAPQKAPVADMVSISKQAQQQAQQLAANGAKLSGKP